MQDFNLLYAAGLFTVYFTIDLLYAKYVMFISSGNSVWSANTSVGLTGLGFLGYYEFMKQPLYVIPILLGVWLGTYLTVKLSNKSETNNSNSNRGPLTSLAAFMVRIIKGGRPVFNRGVESETVEMQ